MSNRLIREDWFTDETLDALSDFEFRLYASIHVKADDYGRFFANPKIIAGACLPLRDEATFAAVRSAIDHMAELGLLQCYTMNGCQYLELSRWYGEQTVRNKRSKYPAPCEAVSPAGDSGSGANDGCGNPPAGQSGVPCPVGKGSSSSPSGDSGEQADGEIRSGVPTFNQVRDYCRETHSSVDPRRFYDYYQAKGWMLGRNPVKDWRALLRSWKNNEKTAAPQSANPFIEALQPEPPVPPEEPLPFDLIFPEEETL